MRKALYFDIFAMTVQLWRPMQRQQFMLSARQTRHINELAYCSIVWRGFAALECNAALAMILRVQFGGGAVSAAATKKMAQLQQQAQSSHAGTQCSCLILSLVRSAPLQLTHEGRHTRQRASGIAARFLPRQSPPATRIDAVGELSGIAGLAL